jgi:hypothetical protein
MQQGIDNPERAMCSCCAEGFYEHGNSDARRTRPKVIEGVADVLYDTVIRPGKLKVQVRHWFRLYECVNKHTNRFRWRVVAVQSRQRQSCAQFHQAAGLSFEHL